ncbi:tail fiber domain-containing protein [Rahnella sp. AN3-3W3]|uniref:tail fiber domain-containing protein n=1 Tax=Rahnella sp. AN3-3W3 TaxID=1610578 RepID=UPI000DD40E92|nr:tail fiber domain-containing protein [Rahnella sp. AN3-3W3]
MSAGTIALTNNSANVTGTGTAFTTDLKAGDFVVVIVGGVTYTLGVKAITSATALTLVTAYGGPTATGNAWTAVPNATLVGITSQVAADVAKAIRGLNLDKANWQKIFSSDPSVTVTRPDLSTFTGPSWGSLSDSLAGKAAKGANTDITSLAGLTTALSIAQGGTGAKTAAAACTALGAAPTSAPVFSGTVAIEGTQLNLRASVSGGGWPFFITFMAGQGNNLPYSRVYGENSGDITIATGVQSGIKYFQHTASGDLIVSRNIQCVSLTQTSDRDKKDFITPISNALDKINAIDGVTFVWKADGTPSAGVIAQDLMKVLPEAIGSTFDENDEYVTEEQKVEKEIVGEDGKTTIETETVSVPKLIRKRDESKRSYTVEYNGVIALAVQAIKELSAKVTELEAIIDPDKLAAISKEESTS